MKRYKKVLNTVVFLVFSFFTSSLFAQAPRQLFVFGDSLSDSGNYFAQFKELEIQPYESNPTGTTFVPSAPYAVGGGRFTNGKTWIEELAIRLGNPSSGKPAMLAPGQFTNYAVGRSRARPAPVGVFDDVTLSTQVESFLADFGGSAPEDATYVIWIGGNDLADSLLTMDPSLSTAALAAIWTQLANLYSHGARDFLIVNLPNLAHTPRIREMASARGDVGYFLSAVEGVTANFNTALLVISVTLQGTVLPGSSFAVLDAFSILDDVVDNPEQHGFSVVDEACVIPDAKGKSLCTHRNRYLFWDGQHPSQAAHSILAEQAFELLSE